MASAFVGSPTGLDCCRMLPGAVPDRRRLSVDAASRQRPLLHVKRCGRGQTPRSAISCSAENPSGRRPEASVSNLESERSSLVNEEVVLFLFQLQLDAELQRALNYEAFQVAREIRARREQVDGAVASLHEAKGEGSGASGAAQAEVSDVTTEGVQLRTELQRAVEEERYADAAQIRDQLNELEATSRQVAATVSENRVKPEFRLGQRIVHKQKGFKGIICGWDVKCCESSVWQKDSGVEDLQLGINQTFYHVLVDEREWSHDPQFAPVAYVAQENVTAPEVDGSTWVQTYGNDPLRHPFSMMLFLGTDGAGDMIPCQQLRSKYNVERRDVYPPGGGEEDDDAKGPGDEPGDAGPGGPSLPGIDMDSLR